jgi:hypothetical protein
MGKSFFELFFWQTLHVHILKICSSQKGIGGEGQALGYSFFGKKGVRLELVVEGEGRAPGTCGVLSMTTHPQQYRVFKLDRRETSATEVCVSTFNLVSLNLF